MHFRCTLLELLTFFLFFRFHANLSSMPSGMPWPPCSSNWIFPRWLIFRAWVLARNVRGLVVFLLRRTVSCLTFSLHHCHRRSCLCIKEALYTWRTRLTEQRDDMLTNQGETAVWMQMKALYPVARADLSKSLRAGKGRVHDALLPANWWCPSEKQEHEIPEGCLWCCLKPA